MGRHKVHGHASGGKTSPTHCSWRSMINRCTNQKLSNWKYYGARGIKVCERWRNFVNFLADMGERPNGKTIDRIDRDGNYEPGNCKWSDASEQNKNRRYLVKPNNRSGVVGVYFDSGRQKWAVQITRSGKTMSLGRFSSIEEAAKVRKAAELA